MSPTAKQEKRRPISPVVVIIALHLLLLLYSLSSLSSKFASQQATFSLPFFMWYAAVLIILVVYALAWQQILKYVPLTVAYANKAITVVWGIMWGALFFNEGISAPMIVGGLMIIVGIVLFSFEDNKQQEEGGLAHSSSEGTGIESRRPEGEDVDD